MGFGFYSSACNECRHASVPEPEGGHQMALHEAIFVFVLILISGFLVSVLILTGKTECHRKGFSELAPPIAPILYNF